MQANRFFLRLAALVLLLSLPAWPAAAGDIKVLLNGGEIVFDVPPQMTGGRTLVPMRGIFEAFQAQVSWDEATQTVTAIRGGRVVVLQMGKLLMQVDGRDVRLDVPPQLTAGRTLVPVRAVVEGLDAEVSWDAAGQAVHITKAGVPAPAPPATRQVKDPALGVRRGYGSDGLAELRYEARFLLEREVFPQGLTAYESLILRHIDTMQAEDVRLYLQLSWEYAAAETVAAELRAAEGASIAEDREQWASQVRTRLREYKLDQEEISQLSLEAPTPDTKILVLSMSDTGWDQLSTYIAFAYRETLGFRYFTLEKDAAAGQYTLVQTAAGVRILCGPVANDKAAFLAAVKKSMS